MSYMTLSSQEKALQKKFLDGTYFFLLCSIFRAHPTTLLLKILGGPMHGPSPTSNFGGTVPHSPLSLRTCHGARAPAPEVIISAPSPRLVLCPSTTAQSL